MDKNAELNLMIKTGFVVVHATTIGVTECYSSNSNLCNMSKLLLQHLYINLDSVLFERKTYANTLVSNTETKYGNHKEESLPKLIQNHCQVEDLNNHIDFQLPFRQAELKIAKINFCAALKELYDLSYLKKDTENIYKNYKFNDKAN